MRLSGICVYKHEATASLDVENETLIQTALSRLIADKTVLVIAHRMRTVAGADKIVVLSEGVVAEEGTPEALRQKNGLYARMITLQTESQGWKLSQKHFRRPDEEKPEGSMCGSTRIPLCGPDPASL